MIKPLAKETNAVLAISPLISVDIFDQLFYAQIYRPMKGTEKHDRTFPCFVRRHHYVTHWVFFSNLFHG